MSGIKRTTHYFKELMSNTEYSVWLRGINFKEVRHCRTRWGLCICNYYYYSKAVEMSWEKIQLMTLAGIICILFLIILLPQDSHEIAELQALVTANRFPGCTLETRRKPGWVNFRRDFWDDYYRITREKSGYYLTGASRVTIPETPAGHISDPVAFLFLKWWINAWHLKNVCFLFRLVLSQKALSNLLLATKILSSIFMNWSCGKKMKVNWKLKMGKFPTETFYVVYKLIWGGGGGGGGGGGAGRN